MAPKKSTNTSYQGQLAETPRVFPACYDEDKPPLWFAWMYLGQDAGWPLEGEDWRAKWKEYVLAGREAFKARQSQNISLLFEHYGIDRRSPSADWQLAMALAHAHVPAFQIERAVTESKRCRSKKGPKLDAPSTVILFTLAYLQHIQAQRPLTAYQIKVLNESDDFIRKQIKERTIRDLKQQMLDALCAYGNRQASDFQVQFVEQVYPMLFGLCGFFDALANGLPRIIEKNERHLS